MSKLKLKAMYWLELEGEKSWDIDIFELRTGDYQKKTRELQHRVRESNRKEY